MAIIEAIAGRSKQLYVIADGGVDLIALEMMNGRKPLRSGLEGSTGNRPSLCGSV